MSLLLDALKKAALEKQRREHSDASAHTTPVTHTAPEPVDLEIEDTPHQKVDVGEENTQLLDEVESEPSLTAENGVRDAASEHQGPELVFDIDEVDSEYITAEQVELEAEKISAANTPLQSYQEPIELSIQEPAQKEIRIEPVITALSDNTSRPDLRAPSGATENITLAKTVEPFSPTAGKTALAQLLSRSHKVADHARKRMLVMYLLLAITAGTILVLYYYFLFSDSSSIAKPMSARQISPSTTIDETAAENLAPESVDNASAPDTTAAENTTVTGTTNTINTENTTDTTNKNSVKEKTGNTTPPQKKSVAHAQPKKVQESAAPNATDQNTNAASMRISNPPKQGFTGAAGTLINPINSLVERGYRAYQAGDLNRAESAYREALALDRYDRDALLGAAAVAVGQGRQQDALNFYQQRLTREPRDEYAQAGIVALSSSSEPSPQLESELNRLLIEYPNASYLYFLKGSLYAKQKQWNAAQAAFFEAWQRDNKNADLACNLAIALDHLNQPKEAARFYHQALELKSNHPGFSVEAIQRRLQELEAVKQ